MKESILPENFDDFFERNAKWTSQASEQDEFYEDDSHEDDPHGVDSHGVDSSSVDSSKSDSSTDNFLKSISSNSSPISSNSTSSASSSSESSTSSSSNSSSSSESNSSKSNLLNSRKHRRAMRRNKSRNSRKSRKQKRFKTIIVLLIVALIVCFAGYGLARAVRSMIGYQSLSASEDWPGPGEGSISFSVEVGESANSIGSRLEKEEIVKSKAVFTSIVSSNNKILYPGIYDLKKHMSAIDVADILSNRKKATGFLEVKAGERSVDIIKRASEISGIDYSKFKAILQAKGAGILPQEASGSFEGWLEPGVYNVKAMKSAEKIMSAMVEKRIAKLNAIGVPKGDKRENILKIASIAEAEVNNREYYGKVSRVILNRIDKDMPLGMDTTIAYGAGVRAIDLTKSMLDNANNPYNTRIHKGLPPTPISIPGPNAIAAAMHPENGSWLYFVTTDLKTGETKFVNTHEEFLKIKDEYKRNNKDAN